MLLDDELNETVRFCCNDFEIINLIDQRYGALFKNTK